MEQNIHTHLFTSALSLREQRMLRFASPEQQSFDDALAKVEASIENPNEQTDVPTQQMAEIRVLAIRNNLSGEDRIDQMQRIIDKKTALQDQIKTVSEKTSDTNAAWKKIKEGFESSDAATKAAAIESAKTLLADSRIQMEALSGTILDLSNLESRLLAKTTVALIAAHNKNIENIQALDPSNTIELVSPRTGGTDAVAALNALEEKGDDFLTGDFNDLLNKYKTAATSVIKEAVLKDIDEAFTARREEIYADMNEATSNVPPFVNVEKMIAELLSQLKEMKDARDEVVGTTPTSPSSSPASSPSSSPSSSPATTPEETPDALKDIPAEKVAAVTNAATPEELQKALDALNELPAVQTNADAVAAALNTKEGRKLNVKVENGKLVQDTTSASPSGAPAAAPAETSDKVSELKQMIEIIKEFLEWLFNKEAEMKGGRMTVPALQAKIAVLKTQEGKILEEEDTPERARKLDEVRQQIVEAETALQTLKEQNNNTFRRLQEETAGNPFLEATQDGSGNTPAITNREGVPASVADPQIDAIMNGLPESVRGRVQKKQVNENTVILYIEGDVHITQDQSRNINITGDNNTVSESQNGDVVGDASVGSPKGVNIDGVVPDAPIIMENPVEEAPRGDLEEMPEAPIVEDIPFDVAPRGDLDEEPSAQDK